jgi:regulator of sigma E protease
VIVLTILIGIFGFGIIVFVHELGHFLAAKAAGIDVEVFSLGWGKKMVGITRGGTSYQISWFPIGGFCKLKGEEPINQTAAREKSSFYAASPGQRILVALAGPFANILFAVLVLSFIWWVGFAVYSDDNRIILAADYGFATADSPSPAERAGLQTGDRIVSINGAPVDYFQDIIEGIAVSPEEELDLVLERNNSTISTRIIPALDYETGAGKIGVFAWRDPVIGEVEPGSVAFQAGLREEDTILRLDDQEIGNTLDIFQFLSEQPPSVTVTYRRGAQAGSTNLSLRYGEGGVPEWGLQFALNVYSSPDLGPGGALQRGLAETWQTMTVTLKGIRMLFRGKDINVRNAVAGPLRITYYVGSVATSGFSLGFSEGFVSFFRFLCLLSVVLFIMNLLPLPALDGGQTLIFLLEIIMRRPVSPRIISRIQVFGFSVLILLFVLITFSDILFFLGR